MKNLKSIMGILIISIITLGFNTNVKAEAVNFESTDLSDKLEVKSYIGDNTFSYETHFDNERNVTIVDITTTLDEATIASIFNHTPGNGNSPAQKGTVYFEIAPGVDGTNFKKDGTIITASDDLSTKKEEVTESIEEESNVNYSEVYVSQINIYYI